MVRAVAPPRDKRMTNRANHGGWLVNVADDVVLPMTTLEVIDGLRKGTLSEQSLVWRIGMHDWTAVLDVPQLRLVAGSRPPPADTAPLSQEAVESARFTPVPAIATPLPAEPAMPSSLAPTTAEAAVADPWQAREAWSEIEELLSNERRADQKSSRRVVLGAAFGAAALAAAFTLFLVRSPPVAKDAPPTPQAAQPSAAPEPEPEPASTPTPVPSEASAAPSASTLKPAAPHAPAKSVTPRYARRPKRATPASSTSTPPVDAQSAAESPAPSVDVVPMAPLDPAPAASVSGEPAPASSTPSNP